MRPGEAIALDGFLDEDAAPGDVHETTARFRLTVSPTDDLTDETTLACVTSDPLLARAVLHELCQGDRLRVTGYLRLPRTPDQAVRLHVHRIEVLATAPLQKPPDPDPGAGSAGPADTEAAALPDGGLLGRHGTYATYRDPGAGTARVWSPTGIWVGTTTDTPAAIQALIDAHQRRTAPGEP
ncbi:OB-fold nucleic acid binding domain-containing protein [Streptomyces sp. TRM 70361]|uniref:OB-fold nucleic acid binding domain-containing protein n=1 Tax=Streptomyces sp. TRM 70361 TaxID=3116553 RepID=UPI002E7C0E0D|nr:OB-fold nucleic acid binding domain-containing protein [Streptomyces sp. TRM 70361]MEE1943282.1 OB-fold nucleic acid binding domain-containing protein [Streptomyces sp. TRM 70361]